MNDTAVDVKDLTIRYGTFCAVDRISFRVERGEVFGFLGANGAGKTTTIRVLCGLLAPTEGEVSVAGVDFRDGEMAIKSKVGYMSQKFTLYNDLTVGENLRFIASLRKLDPKLFANRRKELFDFIQFDRPLKTIVQELPGGIKQQVSLCAALLHDPEIVFLDEPTAGVSPASRQRFWSLIEKLSNSGKTVFVTTHYMDEAEQCDRIALMRDGKIIGLDTPEGLKRSTFSKPVLEFEPKEPMSVRDVLAMEREELFSFFEPYGLRFHASIRDQRVWDKTKASYEQKFNVREIAPSLEDVFIARVEETHR